MIILYPIVFVDPYIIHNSVLFLYKNLFEKELLEYIEYLKCSFIIDYNRHKASVYIP